MDCDLDPRDLERDEAREIDMPWIELGRGPGVDSCGDFHDGPGSI